MRAVAPVETEHVYASSEPDEVGTPLPYPDGQPPVPQVQYPKPFRRQRVTDLVRRKIGERPRLFRGSSTPAVERIGVDVCVAQKNIARKREEIHASRAIGNIHEKPLPPVGVRNENGSGRAAVER